jgi:hypothetical protein
MRPGISRKDAETAKDFFQISILGALALARLFRKPSVKSVLQSVGSNRYHHSSHHSAGRDALVQPVSRWDVLNLQHQGFDNVASAPVAGRPPSRSR